jgi:hypothetical protein
MARIGKIARLPLDTREELNRRLANGELGGSLLRWLNALPAVRDMLEYCFGGAAITKQNLSEWRKGGFREWKMRLEFFSDPEKVAAQAQEIREVSGDKLTHNLATVLAGQYAVVMRRWFAYPTQEVEARLRVLHSLCVDIVALRRRDIEVERMKLDLERWEFDREQILRKMALLERKRAEAAGESKLVQVKNFHRRGAEKRRDSGLGEDATERDFISRSGPNAEAAGVYVGATLPSRCGSQSRAPATEGGRGESNLVQAEIFSGALGSGVRTTAEAGAHSRSGGLLSNICMFAKAGVSFSVSRGLGWSVGTMESTTVEGTVGRSDDRDFDMAPRREWVGDRARERVEVSVGTRRGDSNLRGFAALRDKSGIVDGSRRESNLVQAFFFEGALGSAGRTSTGTEGYARSAGLVPNRYMRGLCAEGVKHWVGRKGPGSTADPCGDPGSATVSVARAGVPPALPVANRFPLFVPEEDGETPVLGDRGSRASRLRYQPASPAASNLGGFHVYAPIEPQAGELRLPGRGLAVT